MGQPRWYEIVQDLRSRNVARAVRACKNLADSAGTVNVPELYSLLNDESFFIREAAAIPLARLEGTRALFPLLQAYERGLRDGHDNDGLTPTIIQVVEAHPKEAANLLLGLLRRDNDEMRANAAWALGFAASEITPNVLIDLVDHDPARVVKLAAVGSMDSFRGSHEVVAKLVEMVNAQDEQIAIQAIFTLGYLEDRTAIPALENALKNSSSKGVQDATKYALDKLKPKARHNILNLLHSGRLPRRGG